MADPFSVAGGAVGIISLGIQLSKEIASYTAAWRDYDEDIQILGIKAEELQTPFKRLRELVEDTRLTDPESASDLNEKASSLQRQIEKVKKNLDQYKPVFPDRSIGKLRNKLKKAAYPITTRDALRDMKSDMDGMQSTIQTALALFNAKKAQKTEAREERMFQLIQDLHLTMRSISPGTIPTPGLLRSFHDQHDEYAQIANEYSQMASKSESKENLSTNAARYASKHWPVSVPRNKRKTRAKSVEKLYQYHSHWLSRAITLSFSLSKGAGGFSIAPVLRIQVLLGERSWVSQKLRLFNTFNHLFIPHCDGNLDNLVYEFQNVFSEGKATPSDMVSYGGFEHEAGYSLVDSFTPFLAGQDLRSVYKFVQFMTECGSVPDNTFSLGVLNNLCSQFRWGEKEYAFASYLIDLGGPITFSPRTWLGKQNMQGLLFRDEELINYPDIGKTILRESGQELKEALKLGSAQPDDRIRDTSLLELAIGWPTGVRILLEFGANASAVCLRNAPHLLQDTDYDECEAYCESLTPLLKAGCKFEVFHIFSCKSKTVRLLLIRELARRRRKLWDLAQSCLPPKNLAGFCPQKDAVIDTQASKLHSQILTQGWEIDPSLQVDHQNHGQSVYHCRSAFPEASEELYRVGFRDIDLPDIRGLTPLMLFGLLQCVNIIPFQRTHIEMHIWLVSKGAKLAEKLPRSNATVAHRTSSVVVEKIFRVICGENRSKTNDWPEFEALLSRHKDTVFLVPSIRDGCDCACCPGGCTTFSVALRKTTKKLTLYFRALTLGERAGLFRRVYRLLILWTESRPGVDQAIIKFLTFEGLRLKHTCCVEIDHSPDFLWDDARDRDEIEHICEEDRQGLDELEQLVSEFEIQFTELQLPITEFLDHYWHTRMVQFLSKRGPYNEEYLKQTRNLGVCLTADINNVPDIVNWFGFPTEEVDSEESAG